MTAPSLVVPQALLERLREDTDLFSDEPDQRDSVDARLPAAAVPDDAGCKASRRSRGGCGHAVTE
jgi:hypothetical protein